MRKLRGPTFIGGSSLTDFNIVCWEDRGLDERILLYCFDRLVFDARKRSTVEEESYILLEWVNWLASRGKTYLEAARIDYLFWNSDRRSAEEVSIARLHRKHEVVWNYYLHLRSEAELRYKTEVFFKSISVCSGPEDQAASWSMKLRRERSSRIRKPRVPTADEVSLVMQKLGEDPTPFIAERNFLIGQVEARIGLRAMGAESLAVSDLDTMLEAEGIQLHGETVATLTYNKNEQARIRRILRQLRESGREVLETVVTEKGDKEREIAIPIDLARRLLDHVWSRRAALVSKRRGATKVNRDALFLSWRTGQPLTRGAIKDLVKQAFRYAGVKGSGHALRAYFLTCKAVELIQKARRSFGENYSLEDIYFELAQYAGHKHRKTLFAYIDIARLWAAALEAIE
jgi:hypothetical protein